MRISRSFSFTVGQGISKIRADRFLSDNIEDLSRSALTGPLCEILVNDRIADKSTKVSEGDFVVLNYAADVFDRIEPQNIHLDVIYEDSSVLVINKAQGMVVHPGAGNPDNTIVNALAYRYGDLFIQNMADECDITRPGIVHRLDKDTSGVMVIALTPQAHSNLSAQFQNRETLKYYYALCDGVFSRKNGEIECNLSRDKNDRKLFAVSKTGGKYSRSSFEVVRQYGRGALVRVRIYTGRTHQIRIHMKSEGHPVIGDVLYNGHVNRFAGADLMLHSAHLEICHPVSGERMVFEAPLPQRFEDMERILSGDVQ